MKKSQITVTGMVLILATFIILALIYSQIVSYISNKTDDEKCRLSLLVQAKTKTMGKTFLPPACDTHKITLFNDHVEKDGKKIEINKWNEEELKYEKIKKYDELDSDVVGSVFADEMSNCFYRFLEGKQDVFHEDFVGLFSAKKVCFPCAEIHFDKEVKKGFLGMEDYFKNPYPKDVSKTYTDYLFKSERICRQDIAKTENGKSLGCGQTLFLLDQAKIKEADKFDMWENGISPEKTYVVYFGRVGNSYLWKTFGPKTVKEGAKMAILPSLANALIPGIGFTVSAIQLTDKLFNPGENDKNSFYVSVAPIDSINNVCDQIIK